MLTTAQLRQKRAEIEKTAQAYGVRSVRVFGSVARGEADQQSDVDLLVEVEEGTSLLRLGGFQYEMEQLLGEKVDVVTVDGLRTRIRERALSEAVAI